jgi:hypothetical protein
MTLNLGGGTSCLAYLFVRFDSTGIDVFSLVPPPPVADGCRLLYGKRPRREATFLVGIVFVEEPEQLTHFR